jgi:hypothetical protein
MRLGAQFTVAGRKAQPGNNCLEPAIADGLLYAEGLPLDVRFLYTERMCACAS